MDQDDLEDRLHDLQGLSGPTTPPLDLETMHRGAARMERRQQLMVAIPSILLVVVVLASAVALRNASSNQLATQGTTQGTAAPAGLTDRDRELLDFVEASIRLRRELLLEGLEAAPYATMDKSIDLQPQRTRTDAAAAAYEERVRSVDPARDAPLTRDALKQFDNRMKSLPTVRRSVDAIQTDAARLVEEYSATTLDLSSVQKAMLQTVDNPPLFRSLWSLKNLGGVTDAEARTAALLTIAVQLGFFPAVLPLGVQPGAAKLNPIGEGCGEDADRAGDTCKLYADATDANNRAAVADQDFQELATGTQKQVKRFADTALRYDELKRHAFEDGMGHNDLTGAQPGTSAVPPADWRVEATKRVNRLVDAELQLLDDTRNGR